ncbi:hypothetical protein D3C85_1628090 [compost metagenome]
MMEIVKSNTESLPISRLPIIRMHRKMKIYISTVKKIWAEICWNIFSSLPLPLLTRETFLTGG